MDAMVPADLHIPMLARDRGRVPQPLSFWRRVHHFVRQGPRWFWIGAVALFVLWIALLAVATEVTGRVPVGGVVGGLAAAAWSFLRERKRE
jgi:hypothetical protein